MLRKPLVLKDGRVEQLQSGDTIEGADDFLSGLRVIEDGKTVIIRENRQMINFIDLTIDGDLILDGDLWLA